MAGIEVTWKKLGPEFTYDVLYSKAEDGPWIKAHNYRLTDQSIDWKVQWIEEVEEAPASAPYRLTENNVFIIENLNMDEQYFVKVVSHDKYEQWWYSYDGPDSLGGGLNSDSTPIPNGGNHLGFQFNVIIP